MVSLLKLNITHCDCKIEYGTEEITGRATECYYHGHGIWQCPECSEIHDHSDKVYQVIITISKVPEEDSMELTYNVELKTEDERLFKPCNSERPNYTLLKSMEDDMYDLINDTEKEKNFGKYKLEIYWNWYQTHSDCGMEWNLDMFIVSEEKIEGDANG